MKKKILVVALAIAMFAVAAVAGTMAWLHDNDADTYTVTTYGDVSIDLTVDDVLAENLYLIPNGVYNFNPEIAIVEIDTAAGEVSEDFFLRMFVTIDNAADWQALIAKNVVEQYDATGIVNIEEYIDLADSNWSLFKAVKADDTFIYEFRYVASDAQAWVAGDEDAIVAPFTNFRLDKRLNDDDVAALQGMKVTFEAQAMQAVEEQIFGTGATENYFATADAAWAEFDKQIGNTYNNPVNELVDDVVYTPGVTLQ